MMLRVSALRAALVLVLVSAAWSAHAAPDDAATLKRKADAKLHYDTALRKYDIGKFDEAAQEFQAAYELIGDPKILYNVGQAYRFANNPERALFFYRNFLRREENSPRRAEVERRITELTEAMAKQKSAAEAPPTGPIRDPVSGTVTTTEPRPTTGEPTREPTRKNVQPPIAPPPAHVEKEPPPPPSGPRGNPTLRYVGYGFVGLTVVGIGLGAAMSALASSAAKDMETAAANRGTFDSKLASTQSSGKTDNTVAIVGYALAGASAVGAAVTLYLGFRGKPPQHAFVAPAVTSNFAGLVVQGHF